MALLVPVREAVVVSVAVRVRLPAVFSVALNVPTPFVNVPFAGSVAAGSLLVKWTVPVYPVAVFSNVSSALTVKLNVAPAVALAGELTAKWVAAAGLTATLAVPVIELV